MTFFSTSEKLEIDNIPFISVNPKPKRIEALEYYRRAATNNDLNINLFEKVIVEKKEIKLFKIISEKANYPFTMQKVVVVGANNSAVDAALEIWRKGGDVTLIVRGKSIEERVEYSVKPDIENRIKEGSIKTYFESEIKETQVIIQTPEGDVALENDFVTALVGYHPNFKFLQDLDIELPNDGKSYPTPPMIKKPWKPTYKTFTLEVPFLVLWTPIYGLLNILWSTHP